MTESYIPHTNHTEMLSTSEHSTAQERLATLGFGAEADTDPELRQRLEGHFGPDAIEQVEVLGDLIHPGEEDVTLAEKVDAIGNIYATVVEMQANEADTRRILGKQKGVGEALTDSFGQDLSPENAAVSLAAYAANQVPNDDIDRVMQAQSRRMAVGKKPNMLDDHANLALRQIQNNIRRGNTGDNTVAISQQLIQQTAEGTLQWSAVRSIGEEMNERRRYYHETGEAPPLLPLQEVPLTSEPFLPLKRDVLLDDLSKTVGGHSGGEIKNTEAQASNWHRVAWLFEMADKWQKSQGIDPHDSELQSTYYASQLDGGSSAYVAVELKQRNESGDVEGGIVFTVSTRPGTRDAAYIVRSDQIPEGMTWQDVLAGTKTNARDNGAVKLSNQTTPTSTTVERAHELLANPDLYKKRRESVAKKAGVLVVKRLVSS